MAAKKRVAVKPVPPRADACPHCKGGRLTESADTKDDTAGQAVTIWDCDTCAYSEGR